jgi:uncharacterized protein YjbI with pentapeptide repeats
LDLINTSKLEFAFIVGKMVPPQYAMSLIVKGTFDLINGSPAGLSGEQLVPTGDIYYPEDEEMAGAPWYESDFAPFKPRADILLVGKCHAPDGYRFQASQVTFRVGHIEKKLKVFGDRHWRLGILGASATDPDPTAVVALRYENSYGGAGYDENPVGKGYVKQHDKFGHRKRMLANIIALSDHLDGPRQKIAPAGFGPLGKFWQHRKGKLGTYKGDWLKQRWPWFPADFDWGFFNAAPQDQQVEGYLTGQEKLYFENLHDQHPHYSSELPGLRVRSFVEKHALKKEDGTTFEEVSMKLDTLWVDMDDEKLVLIWRGWTSVQNDDLDDVGHLMVVSEKIETTPKPVSYYKEQLVQLLNTRDREWKIEPISSEGPKPAAAFDLAVEKEKAEATYQDALKSAGIDPQQYPPPMSEKAKEEEKQILEDYGIKLPLRTDNRISLHQLHDRLSQDTPVQGEDLRHLDLGDLDFKKADFSESILLRVNLGKTNLSQAKLVGANLAETNLSDANLQMADLTNADLTGANLTGADLSGAILNDTLLEGADLTNAVLRNINGVGADFSKAVLNGAVFDDAILCQAEFTRGHLENTCFRGADLSEASMRGVKGCNVNMDLANLTEIRASDGCRLTKSSFQQIIGPESIWTQAELDQSDFSHADLKGADFSSAQLKGTHFHSAVCRGARFTKACMDQTNLVYSDLFEAVLEKAILKSTDFRNANLFGAEFLDAEIDQAQFYGANLKRTKLEQK